MTSPAPRTGDVPADVPGPGDDDATHIALLNAYRRALIGFLTVYRRRQRLSQREVAERMGVSRSAVSRMEAGRVDPHLSTVQRYARAVGAPVRFKITTEEEVPAP